jgi:peptide/nickel transport system permease protein
MSAIPIPAVRQPGPLVQALYRFAENKLALSGVVVLGLLLLAAAMAPWTAPQNPYDLSQLDVLDARQPPATVSTDGALVYWLGSDEQGRDMLSAILYGLRISLIVGFISTGLALVIGTALGLFAGYVGGRTDAIIMRIADMQLSFPAVLLALLLLTFLGPGVGKIITALVAVQWAHFALTARGTVLSERGRDYVQAARGLALGKVRILFVHLLPNCAPPLVVVAAAQLATAITLEATLSFLGVGLPITEPSLGLLIRNGASFLLAGTYWISTFPGVALLAVVVSINLVADRLRDVFNPRLQAR